MADVQERLQAALGTAYQIERELGGGGMSRVFLARERELGRSVVVKVLPPELGADLNADRFRREIQLVASLQHPHIVSVLTAGQADGLLYYTMPLIEGESLRERLDREGELPIGACLRILRDVIDALAYAHRHGLVHRDIKPGNILLTDKHAMVTDFGVAKALSAATDSTALTATGLVLGTPAYMSPEQASAEPHIDHRADLYAVGAVAYEMLTGQQMFRGPSVQAVLAAQLTRNPDPVSTHRAMVPPALATLVMRCLEKHPADRPQSADELLRELEMIGGASAGATVDQSSATSSAAGGALMRPVRLLPILALYILLSLGVLAATRLATNQLGLPDWVFPGAVVLLLIGLPIITTTAIVQRGRLPLAPGSPRKPRESTGHWLTWRKAILGGGLAFALWGVVVAGYMSMRALGIGPVGSLLAAGVLAPRERILVADFTNRSADSLLGGVATEAFRIDFAQSPVVNVLQPNHVRDALNRMKKAADTPLDLTLAREIAVREGIKAVVAGEIATAGSRFVLSARLVSAQTGEVFTAHRETAADSTEVIAAIDKLSEKLRERIGESLRTIRAGEPLERVTTESLEALRKYTQGVRAVERDGDIARGTSLLDEAIALDTAFAMAYRKLGIHLSNLRHERARWVRALTKAFEYRDRLTDRERYMVIGSYYSRVVRDPEKTIAAYRMLLNAYPDDSPALNNLGVTYYELRQVERAEEAYLRAIEADSTNRLSQTNLVHTQVATGRIAQAQVTLDLAAARFPRNPEVAFYRSALAVARGDHAAAEKALGELRAAQIESQFYRALTSRSLAFLATLKGHLDEAERHFRDATDAAEQQRSPQQYLTAAINLGYQDVAIRGTPERGIRRVEEALARHPLQTMTPLERPYIELAIFYALAGRPDRARALRTERDSVIPREMQQLYGGAFDGEHASLGAIAVAEKRYDDAVGEFRLADRGPCQMCMLPYLGRAYELAGKLDSTITIYERYLATRSLFRAYPPVPNAGGVGDALFLAPIHKRLGELYEERGNRAKAAEHYARFAELWKDADPELRPAVADVRRRLARLSGERPQ